MTEPAKPITEFEVDVDGQPTAILSIPLRNDRVKDKATNPDMAEHLVRVLWEKAVSREEAFWEPGLFFTRTTAFELRDPFTIEKVCAHFGVPATRDEDRLSDKNSPGRAAR